MLMAKPSKKGAKSEAEVSADARKKKDILNKVAESNLPTKTILKELGISRSTYYSWLKRYGEEGEEGLLDSRSLAKPEDEMAEAAPPAEEVEPKPAEDEAEVEVEVESPAGPVIGAVSEEEPPPTPEPPPVWMEEPAAALIEEETKEEVVEPKVSVVVGGDEPRKGMGGYAFIAIMLLVVGLLVSISLSNHNSYQLRKSSNTLTLWKGKFAPRGSEMVASFEPLVVAEGEDVSALTNRTYTGKAAVYNAVYAFFIDQVNDEAVKGPDADTGKINRLLNRAEDTVNGNPNGDLAAAKMRLQLAQKRVAIAELGLQKAYQKALPVYEEAMKAGLGDVPMLEGKVEAMQKALGLIPVEVEEEATLEAETVATPEASTEEKEAGVVGTEEETETEAAVSEDETEAAVQPTQRDIGKPIEDLVKRWRGEN
jgi:transposase-like protein